MDITLSPETHRIIETDAGKLDITPSEYIDLLARAQRTIMRAMPTRHAPPAGSDSVGISWHKEHKRWVVRYSSKYIGSSKDKDRALEIRDEYYAAHVWNK